MFGISRGKTYVIDFATLADGRIVGLLATGLLTGKIIVPDLEQYEEANSALLDRARTTLDKLRADKDLKVQIVRSRLEGEDLIKTARTNRARIISGTSIPGDTGSVPVTVLDSIFEVLRPVYLPGAELTVKIVKKGKEASEGIAYLEGGIKVVIENGANLVGKDAEVLIVGSLDTAVGRVVFARPKYMEIK
jgi:uncharacterized protein YacL